MVDLVISTMSTAHSYFGTSSSAACASGAGNLCDFFVWSATNVTVSVIRSLQRPKVIK